MVSLTLKLITLPIAFFLLNWATSFVHYGNIWTAVLTIVILITIGIPMEKIFLSNKTFWLITSLDFLSTAAVIWFLAFLTSGAEVSLTGAVILSAVITAAEYFVHRLLLSKKRTFRT